ncbi:toprim domain-containing protein [Kitasatospora sp. NPDC096204]|uniref:toprim domain-containing protein n=1 Tax=Kitasatospora sp. NPDC096204 TaxID=3364094 RepID=UPI00381F5710
MNGSVEAAKSYHQQYRGSPAEAYMAARGLVEVAPNFGVGFVGSAQIGHERYRGMLAIPYRRPAGGEHGVATVRFRCIRDTCVKDEEGNYYAPNRKEKHEGHGKYQSLPGDSPRLYNTGALIIPSPYIVVSEGEFDTQASELAGVPCVAAQGTGAWEPHFNLPLVGYKKVFHVADGDEAGIKAAEKRAAQTPNGVVIVLGDDHDINSFIHAEGVDSYRKKLGL